MNRTHSREAVLVAKQKKRTFAVPAILAAGSLWGSMGLFVRVYNARGLQSMDIVAIRAMATVIAMFAFMIFFRRELLRIRLRDLWCFLGTGIGSIVFFNYCYFKTISLTSMSVAAVLLYTAPAIVMVLSRILFGERFTVRKVTALVMTFVGCIFVTGIIGDAVSLNAAGILTGLGSGLGYALYSIFSRYAIDRGYHSLTISFYTFLVAAVTTLPFINGAGIWSVTVSSGGMIAFFLVFGVISTVLPYTLYNYGLNTMENGRASIIASVEPLVATLLGIVIFHEKMSLGGVAGMALILGALVLCNMKPAEK